MGNMLIYTTIAIIHTKQNPTWQNRTCRGLLANWAKRVTGCSVNLKIALVNVMTEALHIAYFFKSEDGILCTTNYENYFM